MSILRFISLIPLSVCAWLMSGCGSQGGSTTVVQPSTSVLDSTSADMSRSVWDPPTQGMNRYAESDSSTVTPIGGTSTTTVVNSSFAISYSESVTFDENGNQIPVISAMSTITDAPPAPQLANPSGLSCGTDGIIYLYQGPYNDQFGSIWHQYFPISITAGEVWIPQLYSNVANMDVWLVDSSTGEVDIYEFPPSYTAITTVADTDATANGYGGLAKLVTTYAFAMTGDISSSIPITGVGLEYFSLIVTDYWLPGTGYVEEDTTETFPDYTTDSVTGIPYVSGTTLETWTIKLVGANG